jgi:hypothetical protein
MGCGLRPDLPVAHGPQAPAGFRWVRPPPAHPRRCNLGNPCGCADYWRDCSRSARSTAQSATSRLESGGPPPRTAHPAISASVGPDGPQPVKSKRTTIARSFTADIVSPPLSLPSTPLRPRQRFSPTARNLIQPKVLSMLRTADRGWLTMEASDVRLQPAARCVPSRRRRAAASDDPVPHIDDAWFHRSRCPPS